MLLSGIFYTAGRSFTYTVIGFLSVKALVNIPLLSDFLQRYINMILGPLLILAGIYLLGFLIAVPLLVFTYMKQHGTSWLLTIIFTVIVPALVYSIFELLLRIDLYQGLLFSG